jgi:hypothetical protein
VGIAPMGLFKYPSNHVRFILASVRSQNLIHV